jgi:Tfp pilus assembly protein PilF
MTGSSKKQIRFWNQQPLNTNHAGGKMHTKSRHFFAGYVICVIAGICLFVFFFASCSGDPHRGTPYTIVLRNGEYSLGNEAAEIAENIYRERSGSVHGGEFSDNIRVSPDGSAALYDSNNIELFRVFCFGQGEWIALLPQGFYTVPYETFATSSIRAASRLIVKTKKEQFVLSQFSAFFFRPDIVDSQIRGEKQKMFQTLSSVLKGKKRPPQITSFSVAGTKMSVKVSAGESGGYLALRRINETTADGALMELTAFFDLDKTAEKKYREKGAFIYEASFDASSVFPGGIIGVSAFNSERTMESELFLAEYSGSSFLSGQQGGDAGPSLSVLIHGDVNNNLFAGMLELFAAQEHGHYSSVNIHKTDIVNTDEFPLVIEDLSKKIKENDVFVFFHSLPASADALGDYMFFGGNAPAGQSHDSWELTEMLLKIKTRRFILIMDAKGMEPLAGETAFARLGQRLGTRVMMANCGFDKETGDEPFIIPASENRYISAVEFVLLMQKLSAARTKKAVFFPNEDFSFLDTHIGYGEIRMQTMFSGMVSIMGVDKAPSVLSFGETMIRKLPAGHYTVTMTYRNGRREIKTADVAFKSSSWVNFSYTPDLLEGHFSRLPVFGVNIAELNPANYRKANTAALKAMEVPAWQIAFISGEDFYRKGRYNEAAAEYTRAVSIKNDYTAAYASRGNAYRKMGDAARAIDDYTRALRLKPDYAELYNYRGYLYSQSGEPGKAVNDYTQAIKYRANYADALFNRAGAYSKQGNWDLAIEDYTRVIRLEPDNAVAYTGRARAWQNKGSEANARADFEKAETLRKR